MATWTELQTIEIGDYVMLEKSTYIGKVTCVKKRGITNIVFSLLLSFYGRKETFVVSIQKGVENNYEVISKENEKKMIKLLYD